MKIINKDFNNRIFLIQNVIHSDKRGFFYEGYNKKLFDKKIKKINFVQDNYSFSKLKYTIRGLHYQKKPKSQIKLIQVLRGKILDIVVDINPKSKFYGTYKNYLLDSKNSQMLLIDDNFAHGFCTLEENTLVNYKVNNYYNKQKEETIIWNDNYLNIKWPKAKTDYIISKKDLNGILFKKLKI
tara:strand:- start:146 stop:694 length:549 start_codon:yes stop_codon:yes gene_type:complete